ncbi:MAG: hypothetical protein WCW44_04205 [archaeon]|jgi:hypothetical protein
MALKVSGKLVNGKTRQERYHLPASVPARSVSQYVLLRKVLAADLLMRMKEQSNWKSKFLEEYAGNESLQLAIPKDWMQLSDLELLKKLRANKSK